MSFRVQHRKTEAAEIIRSVERVCRPVLSPDDTLQPRSNARIWKIARIRYGEYRISRAVGKLDVFIFFFRRRGTEYGKRIGRGGEEENRKKCRNEMVYGMHSSRRRKLKSNSRPRERRSIIIRLCARALSHFNSSFSSRDDAHSPIGSLWPLPLLSLSPRVVFSPPFSSERNRITITSANHVGACSRAKKMPPGRTEGTRSG